MGCGASKAPTRLANDMVSITPGEGGVKPGGLKGPAIAPPPIIKVNPGDGALHSAGELLLVHAKTSGDGQKFMQVAFVLHALAKAAGTARALRSDVMMFAAVGWHVEQLLVTAVDAAKVDPAQLGAISDLLEQGTQHLRVLAGGATADRLAALSDYKLGALEACCKALVPAADSLPVAAKTDPQLCAIFAGVKFYQSAIIDAKVAKLRAAKDADAADESSLSGSDEAAAVVDPAYEDVVLAMSRQLERQAATRTNSKSEGAELPAAHTNLLAEGAAAQAALAAAAVQPSEASRLFPVPAAEAERLLALARSGVMSRDLPMRSAEELIRGLGDGMPTCFSVSVTATDMHTERILASVIREDAEEAWFSKSDYEMPRRLTCSQHILAKGKTACFKQPPRPDLKLLAPHDAHIGRHLLPGGTLFEMATAPKAVEDAEFSDEEASERLLYSAQQAKWVMAKDVIYHGTPIEFEGHACAVLCVFLQGATEPSDAQREMCADVAARLAPVIYA